MIYLHQGDSFLQIILRFHLSLHVDTLQSALFDFQLSFDRIDEERKFAPTPRVLIGGTLHLPRVQRHTHFREDLTGLLKVDITGVLHRISPSARITACVRPPRCGTAPCCTPSSAAARLPCEG